VPPAAAQLPLADTLERLRAAIERGRGRELRGLRGDLTWAQLDQARELAADSHARATAAALAADGDPDAEAALALAERIGAPPAPSRSPWWEDPAIAPPPRLDLECFVSTLASLRRDGAPFDEAWDVARDCCNLHTGPLGQALQWSRPAWEAAYQRKPPPRGYRLLGWPEPELRAPLVPAHLTWHGR
jgi:hypothetical protein